MKAPEHKALVLTAKPQDEAVQEWEMQNPGCNVKDSKRNGDAVEILYTIKSEEAAALLTDVQSGECIGTLDGRGGYQGLNY
jgi:hypothetical protein